MEQVNAIKLQREFYLGFADNPQKFINDWLASQNRDLKVTMVTLHRERFNLIWLPWLLDFTLPSLGDERCDG